MDTSTSHGSCTFPLDKDSVSIFSIQNVSERSKHGLCTTENSDLTRPAVPIPAGYRALSAPPRRRHRELIWMQSRDKEKLRPPTANTLHNFITDGLSRNLSAQELISWAVRPSCRSRTCININNLMRLCPTPVVSESAHQLHLHSPWRNQSPLEGLTELSVQARIRVVARPVCRRRRILTKFAASLTRKRKPPCPATSWT